MEKGNGGERKVEKENGGGEKKVEVEDGGEKKPAPAACFTKKGGEDAKFLDTTKDYFKQLQETSADTHWDCIKNRARLAKEYIAEKTSSVSNALSSLPSPPRFSLYARPCARFLLACVCSLCFRVLCCCARMNTSARVELWIFCNACARSGWNLLRVGTKCWMVARSRVDLFFCERIMEFGYMFLLEIAWIFFTSTFEFVRSAASPARVNVFFLLEHWFFFCAT